MDVKIFESLKRPGLAFLVAALFGMVVGHAFGREQEHRRPHAVAMLPAGNGAAVVMHLIKRPEHLDVLDYLSVPVMLGVWGVTAVVASHVMRRGPARQEKE